MWNFDGSSTQQAEGRSSDCLLQPVALYPDTTRKNGALVMCEVLLPDGSPHPTNSRATIMDDPGAWFGFEQEYFLFQDGKPLGFPKEGYPGLRKARTTRGWAYCQRGRPRPPDHGGTPRPVPGCGHQPRRHQRRSGQGPVGVPDLRQGQLDGRRPDVGGALPPGASVREVRRGRGVALQADQAATGMAAGMHCNFSTEYMRETGGKEYFEKLMAAFDKYKNEHIAVYGPGQPPAPDGSARDAEHRQVQLRHRKPWGVDPRAAFVRESRVTRDTWKIAGPTARATPTRSPRASSRPCRPCLRRETESLRRAFPAADPLPASRRFCFLVPIAPVAEPCESRRE